MSDERPDLVVAGAGGGLVAALRGAQLGLDVLLLEASEHYRQGNNTSMSTAMIPGAGSRWQRQAGIQDSPELFVEDVRRKTAGQGDERLALALGQVSARLVEWLADDLGIPLQLVTDFHYPGHSVDRCHTVEGRHGSVLLQHLVRKVRESDRITMMVPARLVDVEVGPDGCTAVVEQPDGTEFRVDTGAVLLATNGYGSDRELVREYLPEIADAVYHGSEASRGDALRIGGRLGADTAYLDAYQGHAALSKRGATLVGWSTVMRGGFLVNLSGHRFGNETKGYSEYAAQLARQEGAEGWLVLDRRIHDDSLVFTDFRQTVESGALVWADSLEELARAIGVEPATLVEEAELLARVAAGEVVDRFGRTSVEAPLQGPFAAVRVVPALFHTQGGLVVDEHARVLRPGGTPIPGIYASGGAAAGISGHGASGYLAGNGLLPALGLAFLAAEHAAAPLRTATTSPENPLS
jgi:fumarate reductase flavoprotein subunit